MTTAQKVQAMSLYLSSFDCYNAPTLIAAPLTFKYELGSNEGAFVTIDGYEYRCHGCNEIDYRNAVSFFLSLV